MKKLQVILAVMMISAVSQGKVSDFNSLISENIKSQNELHKEVNGNMQIVKEDLRNKVQPQKILVVETESYNAPSRKFKFKKETKYFQASDKKNMDRFASEMKSNQDL